MKNITFINAGAGSGKTYRLTEELYKAIITNECKAHEVLLTTFTKKAAEEIKIKAKEKLLKEKQFSEVNNLQNAYIGTVHAVGQKMIQKFWHYIGFPKEIRVIDELDTSFYFTQAIAEVPEKSELNRLIYLNYKFNPLNTKFGTLDVDNWKSDLLKIIGLARTNNISDFTSSKISSLKYAKKIFNSNSNLINYEGLVSVINKIVQVGSELPEKNNKGRKQLAEKLRVIKSDNIKYSQLKNIKDAIDGFYKNGLIGDEVSEASDQLEDYHRSLSLINDLEEYNNLLFDIARRSLDKYAEYKREIGLIDYSDMENGFLKLLSFEDVRKEIKNTIKLVMVDEFQDSSPMQLDIFIKLSEIVDRSIWVGDPKQSIYAFRGTDPALIDAVVTKFEKTEDKSLLTDNLEYSWRSRPGIVDAVNKIFKPALKDQVNEETISLKAVRTDHGFDRQAFHHFNFVEKKINNRNGELVLDSTNPAYNKAIAKSIVKILSEKWVGFNKMKPSSNKDNKLSEAGVARTIQASDIAILCKTNVDVDAIAQELNSFGVKVSSESNSLKETAEYYLIIALVKLVLSQQNVLAKAEIKVLSENNYNVSRLIDDRLEFLNTIPTIPTEPDLADYTEEDYKIARINYLNDKTEYYAQLNSWGNENLLINGIGLILNELKDMPIPQLVEHLINRLNIYSLVLSWGNSAQRQNNLQKIIEYAYKYDERCINMNLGSSPSGFLFYLSSRDSLTESRFDSDDAVNVLTYHKAKGLEWPMVVLANLHKDVDWGFIARNVFGVFVEDKSVVDLDNILSDRTIISLPWMFGAQNSTISDDFINYIICTEEYQSAKLKHNNELKRVMYVGMTRPRDYLITTGISGQKQYPWMTILNQHGTWKFEEEADIESGMADVFNRGFNTAVQKLELSDDDIIQGIDVNQYFSGKKINADRSSEPYFISPSMVENDVKFEVLEFANVQNRIPTGSSAKDKIDVLGNCLHDILYIYIGNRLNDTTDDSLKQVNNIIDNYNLSGILNSNEVFKSMGVLFEFLIRTFNPLGWHRELSLECEIDGQLYKGEADLVLETNEGYILIDYKSYPGSMERVLDASSINSPKSNYAGKHAAQLWTYQNMIETLTSKKVIKKLIYYVVLGRIVELK